MANVCNDRFVWNRMLAMAKKRYENNPKSQSVGEYGMNYLLKPFKQEYPFLKASDSTSLFVVNHNLALAFKKLFEISKSGVGKLRQTLKLPSLYWCAAVVHSFSRADDIFPTS